VMSKGRQGRTKRVVAGAAVATALVAALGGVAAARSTGTTQPGQSTAATQSDQQDPKLNGSVTVPNEQDTGQETNDNEAQEAAELAKLAKVSKDEAIAAATQAVPGEAGKVELDNENGTVVWSVEVTSGGSHVDVKVDAGNGKVLAKDADNDTESESKSESGNESGSQAPEASEPSQTTTP
jgi:uncharacterized membrane protein YkoI